MARKKQGFLEDLIDVTSKLPWWGGLLLAVVTYALLHAYASSASPGDPSTPQAAVLAAPGMIWRQLAGIAQYLFPLAMVIGACISFYKRTQREKLFASASTGSARDAIAGMTWREFELLVGEAFRRRGYKVVERGGAAPDGGVDLELAKDGGKHLVQCKHWKTAKVDVRIVREMLGLVSAHGARGAFVITSGRFTSEALAFAQGRPLTLIGGDGLLALIQQARSVTARDDFADTAPSLHRRPAPVPTDATPACPSCNVAMVRRTAKSGPKAGLAFWGCSHFPRCRGTRDEVEAT